MNETQITIVGNATGDAELRYSQGGLAIASFTVASTPRKFNKQTNEWEDQEALFVRCSAFREFAENIAASITKGTRVIVQGNLKMRSYQDKDGANRTSTELDVTAMGPDLSYATAVVTRATKNQNQARNQDRAAGRGQGQQGGGQQGYPAGQNGSQGFPTQQSAGADEPWGLPAGQGGGYEDSTPF